jgi:hypothetical protein
MKVLGVTTGGPARPDFSILVECELFAQEEILGRERAFRPETEYQKAEQIGEEVQPKQAEFYHEPMSSGFCPSFKLVTIQPVSSHTNNFCGGQTFLPADETR